MATATHTNKISGKKVIVKRFEGNIIVVYNLKGKALKTYEKSGMANFYAKYDSLRVLEGKK